MDTRAVLKRDVYFPKRKIPKLLIVYFSFFHAFGFDFGFTSILHKKYRLIVQRFTLSVSILITLAMIGYAVFHFDNIHYWFSTSRYIILNLVLITTKYKLYHLIYDINTICDVTKEIKILNITITLYSLIMYSIKSILVTLDCIRSKECYIEEFEALYIFVIYFAILQSLDVIATTQIIIMLYLKCSINVIKALLKKPNRKLEVYEKSYMAIADCYDKIRPLYDWLVSTIYNISRNFC